MPVLVHCPSCRYGLQLAEFQLEQQTRCISCQHTFIPSQVHKEEEEVMPDPEIVTTPTQPEKVDGPRHRLPTCPKCFLTLDWGVKVCPHCDHLFQDELIAHRGQLLSTLSSMSLMGGLLGIIFGVSGIPAAILGVVVMMMCNADLRKIQSGKMDPRGEEYAKAARFQAILGVSSGVVLALIWVVILASYKPPV
jgi:hypothetical protein